MKSIGFDSHGHLSGTIFKRVFTLLSYLRVGEVMSPERTNLVLAADVPYGEGDIFVFYRFHVETDGRDRRHDFTQFQFVKDGGFAGSIETDLINTECKAT